MWVTAEGDGLGFVRTGDFHTPRDDLGVVVGAGEKEELAFHWTGSVRRGVLLSGWEVTQWADRYRESQCWDVRLGQWITVPEPTRPPFLRRKLGAKLRRMRDLAGKNLEDAAALLDKTRSALGRIESGETKADVHLIRSMMDIYDQYDPELLDEAREALKPPWFRAYGVKGMGFIDVETEAVQITEFSVQVVPGLLQTEGYMRALFQKRRRWVAHEVDRDVKIRLVRQRRLISEDRPLRIVAVVDEAVLRREVGGHDVMREQLRHLQAAADLPTVSLRVLSLDQGAHCAMPGPFAFLTFPDPEDPDYLYIEHFIGAYHSEDEDKVERARLVFDQLQADALSPADSVALIERLANEL